MKTKLLSIVVAVALSMPALCADDVAATSKSVTVKKIGQYTGWEGQERDLGLIMNMVMKTLNHNSSYKHEMNDALVKALLTHMQFAKDRDMMREAVEHSVETERFMLERVAGIIEKTGDKELALKAIFDQTTCHFQLVLDTESESGMRRYQSPYKNVLTQTRRLNQHDLTEEEIHERWTVPRYHEYSKILGVDLDISPWNDDGIITVRVIDRDQVSMR